LQGSKQETHQKMR